jgi:AcrR family transcriptional regulator
VRITEADKTATRERILQAAHQLFSRKGFEDTSTRDIAQAAKIASGTLFNYFSTKDAIGQAFIFDALARVEEDFRRSTVEISTLEEGLFFFIASIFRHLKPFRSTLRPSLEGSISDLCRHRPAASSLGATHLEALQRTVFSRFGRDKISGFELQVYLGLFISCFSFWLDDSSRHQEKTLALLDYSLKIFSQILLREPDPWSEVEDGGELGESD